MFRARLFRAPSVGSAITLLWLVDKGVLPRRLELPRLEAEVRRLDVTDEALVCDLVAELGFDDCLLDE